MGVRVAHSTHVQGEATGLRSNPSRSRNTPRSPVGPPLCFLPAGSRGLSSRLLSVLPCPSSLLSPRTLAFSASLCVTAIIQLPSLYVLNSSHTQELAVPEPQVPGSQETGSDWLSSGRGLARSHLAGCTYPNTLGNHCSEWAGRSGADAPTKGP